MYELSRLGGFRANMIQLHPRSSCEEGDRALVDMQQSEQSEDLLEQLQQHDQNVKGFSLKSRGCICV